MNIASDISDGRLSDDEAQHSKAVTTAASAFASNFNHATARADTSLLSRLESDASAAALRHHATFSDISPAFRRRRASV